MTHIYEANHVLHFAYFLCYMQKYFVIVLLFNHNV